MPDVGIGSVLSAGASILGGAMAGDASKEAAQTQSQAGQSSIAEQRREFDIGQTALKPYQDVGKQALYKLSDYLELPMAPGAGPQFDAAKQAFTEYNRNMMAARGTPLDPAWTPNDSDVQAFMSQNPKDFPAGGASTSATGSLLKPFSFDISQDPGYQFRMDQGTQAIENSAAARGAQLSGATLKELLKYGSDYASGEYNAAFQRDQATKAQTYGMLTGAAGMGQNATTTGVQAGANTAASIGNTIQGVGNAKAAGQVGQANALSSALSGAAGSVNQAMLLKQILGNPGVNAVNQGVNLGSGGVGDLNAGMA